MLGWTKAWVFPRMTADADLLDGLGETPRLSALARYAILDTAAEVAFDDLARLAAQICGTSSAVITFIDEAKQFFKARVDCDVGPTAPLDAGFCPIVVRQATMLVIPDALADPRHASNFMVTEAEVRFYAGVPIVTPDGYAIGTLCVFDRKPGQLTPAQQAGLQALASQVLDQIELRRALRFAGEEGQRAERETMRVTKHALRLELLARVAAELVLATDGARMVDALYAAIAPTFRLDACLYYACREGGLDLVASAGLTPAQVAAVVRLNFGEALCGMVAAGRKPVHITAIQADDDPINALPRFFGLDTYAGTPLLAGGELLGTLAFARAAGPFSSGELEVLRTLVSYVAMALQRLNAVQALAATSRRRSFLVRFGDRLRRRGDPREIMLAATKMLGRHLMVDRVIYAEIDEAGEHATVDRDWSTESMPSLAGRHRLSDFGEDVIATLRAGRTTRSDDITVDPLISGNGVATAYARIGIRAAITVPLVKEGQLAAVLTVHSCRQRQWTDEEAMLAREVAERTWAAIERARAEAGLREAKATLEQQVAERTAALHANEARLRTIFQTNHQLQGVVALDGTLLDVNATGLASIQATLADVVGKPFADAPWFAGTPGMPDSVRSCIAMVVAGQEARRHVVVNLPTGVRSFDFAMRPMRDETGAVVAIVPEAIDTTDRRQAEEALRQSQKMEAVGQLTGGIAHDFNNLLQGITGSLDMVQRRIAKGRIGELDRLIDGAMASAHRAAALTHRLLAFSRRQPLDPKPVEANLLVGLMEDLLRRTMGAGITLDLSLAAGLWVTLCDYNQLENALLNLVINARDAMPDGGAIRIETDNVDLQATPAARAVGVGPGQYVCIRVTDSGIGMAPETIDRAFDPFFTTKPTGEGTGLGLSMIYGFARQSNGSCRIESKVGQGTVMTLYLPRHHGHTINLASLAQSGAVEAKKGDVVLVVEDEPVVRALVVEVLRELGYDALEAEDGVSGLDVLRSDQHIDLLVTDVGLPGLNGRQMADAARELRPDLKVLFMTGYAENTMAARGFLKPGMAIITKPFAMDALITRIRAMIMAD